jgi:RNA polymerase sigma factor (TIGR02999 family)
MSTPNARSGGVTDLLLAWSDGDGSALEKLLPLVHKELRRLASFYMKNERRGHTSQTTALVNEAYLRLADVKHMRWQNRAHFFALSATLMRRVLIDAARSRNYKKREGNAQRISLDQVPCVSTDDIPGLLALDEALKALSKIDPRKSQVVEMRFFGGLSVEQTAEVLKISPESVRRDWRLAKAWLFREVSGERRSAV